MSWWFLFRLQIYLEIKKRPVLVSANLPGDDIILCQITSQQTKDVFSISVNTDNFAFRSLPVSSNIRPTRIFTADKGIILRRAVTLKTNVIEQVTKILIELLK